jgi:hypothetical protein
MTVEEWGKRTFEEWEKQYVRPFGPPPQSEARTNKEKKSVMAFIRSPFIWYIVCGVVFLFLMLAVTGCIKPPPSSLPLLR